MGGGAESALALLVGLVAVIAVARLVTLPAGDEPEAAPEPPPAVDDARATSTPPPTPAETPAAHYPVLEGVPVFSEPTGTVLLFAAGAEAGVAFHLDSGSRRRVPLEGQRAGDQPFPLWRLGDEVVVGWGEVYAVTPADGSSRHLATATIFLPAAESDQLWLIDHSGGGLGSGASTWTLIDAAGSQLARVEVPFAGLEPVRGLPGGLALRIPGGGLVRYAIDTAAHRHLRCPRGMGRRRHRRLLRLVRPRPLHRSIEHLECLR